MDTVQRIASDLERNLMENESITTVSQTRFKHILSCLPRAQRAVFTKKNSRKTTEENILSKMLNLVTYPTTLALQIHRPNERPDDGDCLVKRCQDRLPRYACLDPGLSTCLRKKRVIPKTTTHPSMP